MRQLLVPLLVSLLFFSTVSAQEISNKKFGEVKISDLTSSSYPIDSAADAVVLAETGYNRITGNGVNFSVVYYEHKRLKILNKSGFNRATIEIYLYRNDHDAEKIDNLNAVVYNAENGAVVKTPLDNASVFTDKINDNYTVKKFTFPNIKEGSVIEYEYSIKSPFYYLPRPWMFQDYIPKLHSEFYISFPKEYIEVTTTKYAFIPFETDTSYNLKKGEMDKINEGTSDEKTSAKNSKFFMGYWTMKDIPALKRENLISSLKNYRARVEFTAFNTSALGSSGNDFTTDWFRLIRRLTWSQRFGELTPEDSLWLNKNLKEAIANTSDDRERAINVYEYIRDNFTNLAEGSILLSRPLKKIYEDKSGTNSDLNLLLTAALRSMMLNAVPVLASTRPNGTINTVYPQLEDYNYVICRLRIGDSYFDLDASKKMLGFGQLDKDLYNGSAFVTNPMQLADEGYNEGVSWFTTLSTDSLREARTTNVFIVNEEKNTISGSFSVRFGQQESLELKDRFSKLKKDEFKSELVKAFTEETAISNPEIDSLTVPGEAVTIRYDFKSPLNDEPVIYFNPFIAIDKIENPLKSADRMFPVELPYCKDEMYVLNMEIPEGYKVDEMPKSIKLKLNENEGSFEYLIGQSGDRIMLKYRLQLNKTIFDAKEYSIIRDFFSTVIMKQNEQIVFKKAE